MPDAQSGKMPYMALWKRIALVLLTVVSSVGCDQKTKSLAGEALRGRDDRSFLADTIRLEYAENPGAFLGVGALLPAWVRTTLFMILCSVGITALLAYTLLSPHAGWTRLLTLSLICGGGLGNLIDRWTYGYTRDFLNVGLGPVRSGIFNLADIALMTGCFLLMVQRLRNVG
jgi:signal peptidase II